MTDQSSGTRWRLANTPMPPRVAALPRTREGYPIPWFVPVLPDGTRDVRIMGEEQWVSAVRHSLCWICGGPMGQWKTFTIGPMCVVNRITAEPPAHLDCAEYAAVVCPFLSRPAFERRPAALPEGSTQPPGLHSAGNPGVCVTWTTRRYDVFRLGRFSTQDGARPGRLISIGSPSSVVWWHEGRHATAAAAGFALETGLGTLRGVAMNDKRPDLALDQLQQQYEIARRLLPSDDGSLRSEAPEQEADVRQATARREARFAAQRALRQRRR